MMICFISQMLILLFKVAVVKMLKFSLGVTRMDSGMSISQGQLTLDVLEMKS